MCPRLFAVAALLVALSACGLVPVDETTQPSTETAETAETAETVETVETADTGVTDGECRLEGEACIRYENGSSNCCISRHTCFPEGCYYTL